MAEPYQIASDIADRVLAMPDEGGRRLIAIAGPPAAGKTTVTQALRTVLSERGIASGVVAMDGFHLGNGILDARGLRTRKGAPETFDLAGFASLLSRLVQGDEVIAPTFDRRLDASIGSNMVIGPEMSIALVEGNYLLLDEPGWRDLSEFWSYTIRLTAPVEELERRLVQRWLKYGFSEEAARAKALENDIPNARRVEEMSQSADMTIRE